METFLLHGPGNPRNSEGCFEKLSDGTLVFAYTRYSGNHWDDECTADIALIRSKDNGRTWSEPEILVRNNSQNVMSVSLLRLHSGKIGMAYLRKTMIGNTHFIDCRPYFCASDDEMKTWSPEVDISGSPFFYMCCLNNCLVQTESGRLFCPGSFHRYKKSPTDYGRGIGIFYYSDDDGATWEQAPECCYPPQWLKTGLQEPGVIELAPRQLMSWFRTGAGCQYKSFSYDNGMSWSEAIPAAEFRSPGSPMTMKRNPANGDIYALWNDHHPERSVRFEPGVMGRTPLVLGISSDNGKSWRHHVLENAPDHGFGYAAMFFNGDELLTAYCCGGTKSCSCMLQDLKINVINWKELV